MAWLFIDSAEPQKFRLGLLDGDSVKIWEHAGRSHEILGQLAKHVPYKILKNTSGICVVSGPGSFTAIRTGVLIANLLARLFKKLLVGVSVQEAQDLKILSARLAAGKISPSVYVKPEYDTEPNITLPKTA